MSKAIIERTAGSEITRGDIVAVFDDGRLHPLTEDLLEFYPPAGVAMRCYAPGMVARIGDPEGVIDHGMMRLAIDGDSSA